MGEEKKKQEQLTPGQIVHNVAYAIMAEGRYKAVDDTHEIYIYDKEIGIYRLGAEELIEARAEELLGDGTTRHRVNEILGVITRKNYISREEFDANPDCVVVKNGILNIKTLEFSEHSPSYLSLKYVPVNYLPSVDCPAIKKFIGQVVDEQDALIVQKFTGFMLVNHYKYRKMLIPLGPTHSGKTTFVNLVKALLGRENAVSITMQQLTEDRFMAANLFGKMANVCDDMPASIVKNAGVLKQLTGESPVTAQRKFKDSFEFTSRAKQVFTCNKLPPAEGAEDAYFGRCMIVEFPHQFIEGKNADVNLLEKLTTEEELSGFLNWAIEGYKQLERDSCFGVDEDAAKARERYMSFADDSISQFLSRKVILDSDSVITTDMFFQEYIRYCLMNVLPTKEKNAFYRAMESRIGIADRRRYPYDKVLGRQVWSLVGIKVKEETE